MKRNPLTKGKFALVDDEDFPFLSQFIRHSWENGKDKVEAAKAYDKATLEQFGEFAWLNFPKGGETPLVG